MGNEQSAEDYKQNTSSTDAPKKPAIPTVPRIPLLQESNVKYFGKRWRTDHDKFEVGTITILNDGSITFINSDTNIEKSVPISSLTGIGECTITIQYPVTLLVISYTEINEKAVDVAFLLRDSQIWIDVLHYQTKLLPQNIVYTPECAICLMEADNYTYLVNCNHMICQYCFFNYIKSQIKDASKYPMKCFNFKCNAMLNMNDVQFAFSALPDSQTQIETEKMEQKNEENDEVAAENKLQFDEVDCICGQTLDKISTNPYSADKTSNILCDICLCKIKCDDNFYHCSQNKQEAHPQGYDLCIDCGDVRRQTQSLKHEQIPICKCGDKLRAMLAHKCYGTNNGVVCNECKQMFKDCIVWHCSETFVKPHENGYDLCVECGTKHSVEYKQREEEENNEEKKEDEEEIDMDLINKNQAQLINYANPTTKQDYTAIYGKFSVLCAMPESERDQCPKCEMVFFGEPRLKSAEHHKFVKEDDAKLCANKQCRYQFKIVFAKKLRCILCGEIYCEKCRNYKLELAKGSDAAQRKYIASEKVKQHKSKLSLLNNISVGISNIFKSDLEIKEEELLFEQKELQRTTSDEKKEIISNTIIDCCHICWLQYYRGLCGECNFEYCLECRKDWHPNIDCVEQKRQESSKEAKDAENDKLNDEFFKQQGFVECPRCGMVIEKTHGCNAIPHKCKLENETKYTHIYVCHCCGEYLKDHDHEKDGTNHFPDGPFSICRIKKK